MMQSGPILIKIRFTLTCYRPIQSFDSARKLVFIRWFGISSYARHKDKFPYSIHHHYRLAPSRAADAMVYAHSWCILFVQCFSQNNKHRGAKRPYKLGGDPVLTVVFVARAHQPTLWVDLRVVVCLEVVRLCCWYFIVLISRAGLGEESI
jgi:hypothetical protein